MLAMVCLVQRNRWCFYAHHPLYGVLGQVEQQNAWICRSACHQEATWYLLARVVAWTKGYAGHNWFPGNARSVSMDVGSEKCMSMEAFSSLDRWVSPQTGGVPLLHITRNGSGRLLGLAILKIAAVPVSKAQTRVSTAPGDLGSGLAPQPIILFGPVVSLLLFLLPGRLVETRWDTPSSTRSPAVVLFNYHMTDILTRYPRETPRPQHGSETSVNVNDFGLFVTMFVNANIVWLVRKAGFIVWFPCFYGYPISQFY